MKKLLLPFFLFSVFYCVAQNQRIWSTYYGGEGQDYSYGIATDTNGNIYLCGRTNSSTYISSNGFQNTIGGDWDAFLVKFDSSGNRLWATYYGGEEDETGLSIAIDSQGNVYMAGRTSSTSNISNNGFQSTYGGGIADAFLVKFDSLGNRLWTTYYGGPGIDIGYSIMTDANANVYLCGHTASISGISFNGFQNTIAGVYDAFLVKFDTDGNRLWATYYGGVASETGYSVASDTFGNIYLAGQSNSTSGISSSGFQNTNGGYQDAFLAKFDSLGTQIWATYYGGENNDCGYSIATDESGNIYLGGQTSSFSDISFEGHQNSIGGEQDAFLVKFDSSGNRLWATYYGGESYEEGSKINITTDNVGNVYMAADSYSSSGIAAGGFQNNLIGTENEFLVKYNSDGILLCATYYGQTHDEDGVVATDIFGNVYLSGYTNSVSNIASGGFQNTLSGANDTYLVKFISYNGKPVDVNENDVFNSFENIFLYPNPANGNLILKSNLIKKNTELKVFNSLGQQVFVPLLQQEENRVTLYTTHLAAGVYSLVLNNSAQQVSKRFVKE